METVTGLEVAIVGMAARLPGANSLNEYWDNLLAGKDILKMQGLRYPDQNSNLGGVLDNVHGFDASFFDIAAREACLMDPQLRHSLEISWQALEDAGLINQRSDMPLGVYAGAPTSAYLTHGISNKAHLDGAIEVDELIHHNAQELFASKIAYQLDLNGPALSLTTGCSTSFVLLHYACLALNGGDCEAALVVASRIGYPHYEGYSSTPGGPLSPDGICRPFAEQATGMVPGSGTLAVVLKRYEDALADGDRIYSVIRGCALNNDGRDKLGYAAPSVNGQASVAAAAMLNADVEASDVAYVEAHGTGTKLGDGVELRALKQAYMRDTGCHDTGIGSVKGNIGHLDAASGLASLVKVSLMLHRKTLLPTINCEAPLAELTLPESPFYIQQEVTPWPESKPMIAGLNIFGIGGTNGHVLLQAHESTPFQVSNDQEHILFISGKNPQAVVRNCDELCTWLKNTPRYNADQLSWTLYNCKVALNYRAMVSVTSNNDIQVLKAIKEEVVTKAQGELIVSIQKLSQSEMVAWECLVERDEALKLLFKQRLSEFSTDLNSLFTIPSHYHELCVKLDESEQLSNLFNHAVWLSLLARLSQLGVKFDKLYASGASFITIAQWAGLLTTTQALNIYKQHKMTDAALLPAYSHTHLYCCSSYNEITARDWQNEIFWQSLFDKEQKNQLVNFKPYPLHIETDIRLMVGDLWQHGLCFDSDSYFGQRFEPISIPGYAFERTRYKLPLKKPMSSQWMQPQWLKCVQEKSEIQPVIVLMPKGKAATAIQSCFDLTDKAVWYVYTADRFEVVSDNTFYADLTQSKHLALIVKHVKTCHNTSVNWVDARLNVFKKEPDNLLNTMLNQSLRSSWQTIDKHTQSQAENWTLLFITQKHPSWQKMNQLGHYVLDYFTSRYQDLSLDAPPHTLLYEIDKINLKRQSTLLSNALFTSISVSKARQFKFIHKQLLCLSHIRTSIKNHANMRFSKVLLMGIELQKGVEFASGLPEFCDHIVVILPMDFPRQQSWSLWLKTHVEDNLYSQIVMLFEHWQQEGVEFSWHIQKPRQALHKCEGVLGSDMCINLVQTESGLSQTTNLLEQQASSEAFSQLLSRLTEDCPFFSTLVLLQGPCTAGLTNSAKLWHNALPKHTFASAVFAHYQLRPETLNTYFNAVSLPTHCVLFDEVLVSDGLLSNKPETFSQQEPQYYAARPDLDIPYEAPETQLEKEVAQVWQSYFYLSPIGRHDDFFMLNGHSLLALKIVNHINEMFAMTLTLQNLLERPSVAELSTLVLAHTSAKSNGATS
jgi:3-oxoacyl-(acyl-carrier-protein) synthase